MNDKERKLINEVLKRLEKAQPLETIFAMGMLKGLLEIDEITNLWEDTPIKNPPNPVIATQSGCTKCGAMTFTLPHYC